jgi:hypothetical protein
MEHVLPGMIQAAQVMIGLDKNQEAQQTMAHLEACLASAIVLQSPGIRAGTRP